MKESQNILFVDSDPAIRKAFKDLLEGQGHVITLASDADEAIGMMHSHINAYNLIVTDLDLKGSGSGIRVIEEGYIFQVKCEFWLVSASLDNDEAQLAFRAGAKVAVNKVELNLKLHKEGYIP